LHRIFMLSMPSLGLTLAATTTRSALAAQNYSRQSSWTHLGEPLRDVHQITASPFRTADGQIRSGITTKR
jgi:hypothetical protein